MLGGLKQGGINHHKLTIVDCEYVIGGSANYTENVLNGLNREDIIYMTKQRVVEVLTKPSCPTVVLTSSSKDIIDLFHQQWKEATEYTPEQAPPEAL